MKAIETHFKGYKFRSRLEARWAVLLDAIGAAWMYEHQGYVLDGTPYLPDFWINLANVERRPYPEGDPPIPGFWLEIKPTTLTAQEESLCKLLALHSRHNVYAAGGNIGLGEFVSYKWYWKDGGLYRQDQLEKWSGNSLLFYLLAETTPKDNPFHFGFAEMSELFKIARSARFEHGETP